MLTLRKPTLSLAALLIGASAAFGQSKFDGAAANFIGMSSIRQQTMSRAGEQAEVQPVAVIVTFNTESDAVDYVSNTSHDVITRLDELVIVRLTPEQMEELAKDESVFQISLGNVNQPLLDVARSTTGIDQMQAGFAADENQTPVEYDGRGVLVGLMDMGLDPNHANFITDGTNRITRLWTIEGNTSATHVYDTPRKIEQFTTDRKSETHGTHVLGIITGGYKDNLRAAFYNASGRPQTSGRKANPYYGVAPGAEIAVTCGTFQATNLTTAADLFASYAEERALPAVMNFSLGSTVGPHDGTTAVNKFLSKIGEKVIICLAAGNEGGLPISSEKTFTGSDNTWKSFISRSAVANSVYVDIWANNDKPLNVTFEGVNLNTGNSSMSINLQQTADSRFFGGNDYSNYGNVTVNKDLNDYFGENSLISYVSNVDKSNNRYHVSITVTTAKGSKGSNIAPAVVVKGENGQTVNIYTDSKNGLYSNNIAGFVAGDSKNSISDTACGDNVIVVGAYTNRVKYNTLGGVMSFQDETANKVASFSSSGTTFDGRQLPNILAPGCGMISSYSYYYINDQNLSTSMSAELVGDNRTSYWGEMSGTSMATPFVSGVCALWLQADPTLKVNDIKKIMQETAIYDDFCQAAPERSGWGRIAPLAGLKKILDLNSVGNVVAESKIIISREGDAYNIFAPTGNICAELVNMAGAVVARQAASGNELSFELPTAQKGVYVLRVNAGNETASRKIVL